MLSSLALHWLPHLHSAQPPSLPAWLPPPAGTSPAPLHCHYAALTSMLTSKSLNPKPLTMPYASSITAMHMHTIMHHHVYFACPALIQFRSFGKLQVPCGLCRKFCVSYFSNELKLTATQSQKDKQKNDPWCFHYPLMLPFPLDASISPWCFLEPLMLPNSPFSAEASMFWPGFEPASRRSTVRCSLAGDCADNSLFLVTYVVIMHHGFACETAGTRIGWCDKVLQQRWAVLTR